VTPATEAVIGAVLGIGGAVLGIASRYWPQPRTDHAPDPAPAGVAPTEFRYCPDEFRPRAAVAHPDGSAHCHDCGTYIPATDGAA
jgi:hypothetical protein